MLFCYLRGLCVLGHHLGNVEDLVFWKQFVLSLAFLDWGQPDVLLVFGVLAGLSDRLKSRIPANATSAAEIGSIP